MRIVDRKTFLAMPAGTLYAKFSPHIFGDLLIKGDTVNSISNGEPIDWYYQDLIPWPEGCNDSGDYFDALDRMIAGESSTPLDFECEQRDGLFDQDQQFAVFEREDHARLNRRLESAFSAAGWTLDGKT